MGGELAKDSNPSDILVAPDRNVRRDRNKPANAELGDCFFRGFGFRGPRSSIRFLPAESRFPDVGIRMGDSRGGDSHGHTSGAPIPQRGARVFRPLEEKPRKGKTFPIRTPAG